MRRRPVNKKTFLSKDLIAETSNSTVQRIVDMELALLNPTETDFSHFDTRNGAGKWVDLIFHNGEEKEKGIFRRPKKQNQG